VLTVGRDDSVKIRDGVFTGTVDVNSRRPGGLVRQGSNERRGGRAKIEQEPSGRRCVVHEERELHRIAGRLDTQHFARGFVFADDEVARAEAGDGVAGLIDGGHVHRPLDGLRRDGRTDERCGQRTQADNENRENGRSDASDSHRKSIGPAFHKRQGIEGAKWFEMCRLRQMVIGGPLS